MTLLCRKHEQIACDDLLIKDLDDPQLVELIIRWSVEILTGNGELLSEVFREMYKGERTFGGV